MSVLSTSFYHLLGDNLSARPNKVALIDPLQSYTYSELAIEVELYATYFEAHSVSAGDRIVISLRKSVAEVAAMFAASKVGAVIVNANAQLAGARLSYVVRDSAARVDGNDHLHLRLNGQAQRWHVESPQHHHGCTVRSTILKTRRG